MSHWYKWFLVAFTYVHSNLCFSCSQLDYSARLHRQRPLSTRGHSFEPGYLSRRSECRAVFIYKYLAVAVIADRKDYSMQSSTDLLDAYCPHLTILPWCEVLGLCGIVLCIPSLHLLYYFYSNGILFHILSIGTLAPWQLLYFLFIWHSLTTTLL